MISLRMNTDLLVGSNGRENSSPSASIGPFLLFNETVKLSFLWLIAR